MALFANADGGGQSTVAEEPPRLVEYFAVIGANDEGVEGGLVADVIDRYPLADHEGIFTI